MEKNFDTLNQELELLKQEQIRMARLTNAQKTAFANEIKNEIGKDIINYILNPNKHKPKKITFWEKLKRALGI